MENSFIRICSGDLQLDHFNAKSSYFLNQNKCVYYCIQDPKLCTCKIGVKAIPPYIITMVQTFLILAFQWTPFPPEFPIPNVPSCKRLYQTQWTGKKSCNLGLFI